MFLLINLVELLLELMEEAEIGFTHNVEYSLGSMFGSDLETSGDMLGYKFASIVVMAASLVGSTSFGQKDIVANTASDERLLDLGKSVDLVIELDERRKVGVHILAHLGEDTRRSTTDLANRFVASVETIHIGRWSAEVANVAFEPRLLDEILDLTHNAIDTT